MIILRLFAALLVVAAAAPASAQENEGEERSRFVRFVERQISTPNRQIRLGGIEGALSSDVAIGSITVADGEGVWLRIEGVRLVWSRRALLRRRLEVELLEAERIAVLRAPLPAEAPAEPFEERTFELPDLPVVVNVETVRVPLFEIAEGVIGQQGYELSLAGSVALADGALDADLAVERRDGAGSLRLAAAFSNETRMLDLNFLLSEPQDGVVANLLNLEGRPAVTFAIRGSGPIADFSADIELTADGEQLVEGEAGISGTDDGGFRFVADVGGSLERLVPPLYREFVDAGSRLAIDATRGQDGAVTIAQAELTSGVASLRVSGSLAPDGVPVALDLEAVLAAPGEEPLALPGGGGDATIRNGRITASLGHAVSDAWTARFELQDLATPAIDAEAATITASGVAANMADPENRRMTFDVTGSATGLSSEAEEIASALGDALAIEARGAWSSGEPLAIETADVEAGGTSLGFAGTVDTSGANGSLAFRTADLRAFSAIAGREVGGAVDVSAEGTLAFSGETFALTLDGTSENLQLGVPAIERLLDGTSTIGGTVARSAAGLRFDSFALENPQIALRADGDIAAAGADFEATAVIEDVAAMTDRASGRLSMRAAVTGAAGTGEVSAQFTGDNLVLMDQPFTGAEATFEGTIAGAALDGRLAASGDLGGAPVRLAANLETLEGGARAIRDIAASVGETSLTGALTLSEAGTYSGSLDLEAPDVSTIAPLFLVEASGALSADIKLAADAGLQSATVRAEARELAVPGPLGDLVVGSAEIDLSADDLFAMPRLAGEAAATDVRIGDYAVSMVSLQATPSGEATGLELQAELPGGGVSAGGSLSAVVGGGSRLTVETLGLSGAGIETRIADPFEVTVRAGRIAIDEGVLEVGSGRLSLAGEVGETLEFSARMEELPLALADVIQPDLEAGGTLSGQLSASGTAAAPTASFDLEGDGITVALLDLVGIDPISLRASGRYAGGTLTLDAAAEVIGRTITINGSIGEALDVAVGIDDFPLSVVNAMMPELEVAGTLSGRLLATGSLADPQASFELNGDGISIAQLRAMGLPPVGFAAAGRVEDGAAVLASAAVEIGGGRIAAEGTIGEKLDVTATITDFPLSTAGAMLPGVDIEGTLSGTARATGLVFDPEASFELSGSGINTAELRAAGLPDVELVAAGRYEAGAVRLSEGAINVGAGSIDFKGTVGEELDFTASTSAFPLSVAGAARPDLNLGGTLSGTLRATGFVLDPQASFDIRASEVTAAPLEQAGLPALHAAASGTYEGGTAMVDASIEVGERALELAGSVGDELDLTATLTEFPASVAGLVQPDLALRGSLSGTVTATGSLTDPSVSFDLRGSEISAAPSTAGTSSSADSSEVRSR